MANREIYNIYHHNSGSDEIDALESILDKIHNDDRYSLISMTDSILPSGSYIAVVHYTVTEAAPKVEEARVSADAEL